MCSSVSAKFSRVYVRSRLLLPGQKVSFDLDDGRVRKQRNITIDVRSRMGFCGTSQSLGPGGMPFMCRLLPPLHCSKSTLQLPLCSLGLGCLPVTFPLVTSVGSKKKVSSLQRTFPQHFVPGVKNRRSTKVCFVPTDGDQDLSQAQPQPSVLHDDLSASKKQASTVVEHVVFFKVKDDPKTEELFDELRALNSLDGICELKAGKVLQILGANFTHVLHSRHVNKASLEAYAVHPSHQAVVKKLAPYIEDRLALDWETVPVGLTIDGGHGAARITLIKLADDLTEEDISQVFAFLNGLRKKFPFIQQITAGLNFSPARAKGFNVGFVAMFSNLKELEQLNGNAELHAELRKSKVAPFLVGFVIADIDTKFN